MNFLYSLFNTSYNVLSFFKLDSQQSSLQSNIFVLNEPLDSGVVTELLRVHHLGLIPIFWNSSFADAGVKILHSQRIPLPSKMRSGNVKALLSALLKIETENAKEVLEEI